jgi:hypothetical protein
MRLNQKPTSNIITGTARCDFARIATYIFVVAYATGNFLADSAIGQEESITLEIPLIRKIEIRDPGIDTPKITEEPVTLFLNPEGYELREPKGTRFYSAASKTLVSLEHDKNEHTQMSMHALVWFLNSEIVHRHAMCHALEAAGIEAAESENCTRFELESTLSYIHPQASKIFDDEEPKIEHSLTNGVHRFSHKDKEYVSVTLSPYALDAKQQASFRRFLTHQCQIHPKIRLKIIETGSIPAAFSFLNREGLRESTTTYTLEGRVSQCDQIRFAPPENYTAEVRVPRVETILANLQQTTIPSKEALLEESRTKVNAAVKANQTEVAVLEAQRYFAITDSDAGLRELLKLAGGMGDKEVRRMVYGLGSINEIKSAKKTLEAKKQKIAYILDYFLADLAMAQHRTDEPVLDNLFQCLEHDPLIVGAYVDLWRIYLNEWDPYTAWRCLDAAKKISPHHTTLLHATKMERAIELENPDFF